MSAGPDNIELAKDLAFAIVSPILMGGFIVMIGVGGSFLKPATRRWIERFVFGPLFFVVGAAGIALLTVKHQWVLLACLVGILALTITKVIGMMRHRPSDDAPPSAPTVAGV